MSIVGRCCQGLCCRRPRAAPCLVSALAEDFLDLEQLAEDRWELDVTGRTSASLGELDGFGGVDADHRWLLALRCSTCRNPAPRFLTVLEPVSPEERR